MQLGRDNTERLRELAARRPRQVYGARQRIQRTRGRRKTRAERLTEEQAKDSQRLDLPFDRVSADVLCAGHGVHLSTALFLFGLPFGSGGMKWRYLRLLRFSVYPSNDFTSTKT